MVAKKLCPLCRVYKAAEEFTPSPANITGLSRYCKACEGKR